MNKDFDIIEFMSGLENIVLDKAVLMRIALERHVKNITDFDMLTIKDIDLLDADICMAIYYSANHTSSFSHSHGSFTHSIGSQTLTEEDKERFYKKAKKLYEKYDDDKLDEVKKDDWNLQWLSC